MNRTWCNHWAIPSIPCTWYFAVVHPGVLFQISQALSFSLGWTKQKLNWVQGESSTDPADTWTVKTTGIVKQLRLVKKNAEGKMKETHSLRRSLTCLERIQAQHPTLRRSRGIFPTATKPTLKLIVFILNEVHFICFIAVNVKSLQFQFKAASTVSSPLQDAFSKVAF